MNGNEWAHELAVRDFLKKKSDKERERRSAVKAEKHGFNTAEHRDAVRAAEAHLTAIGFKLVEHVKHFDSELL